MMTDKQIFKEIAVVKDRLNDVEMRISSLYDMLHEQNAANIDYLSAMSGIDIPTEDEEVIQDAQ